MPTSPVKARRGGTPPSSPSNLPLGNLSLNTASPNVSVSAAGLKGRAVGKGKDAVSTSPVKVMSAAAARKDKMDVVSKDWPGATAGELKKKKSKPNLQYGDRFIPNRDSSSDGPVASAAEGSHAFSRSSSNSSAAPSSAQDAAYGEEIAEACGMATEGRRILAFNAEPPESTNLDVRSRYAAAKPRANLSSLNSASRRRIPSQPERVLDAPGLLDDYYLNLLDWSSTNQLAIGLETSVYVWNADTGDVGQLCDVSNLGEEAYVSSLKWTVDGSYLALGLPNGDIQIYDAETSTLVRTMRGHQGRVAVLAWDHEHLLSSGCADGNIHHHDVRAASHLTQELHGHASEVCGLEWRRDGALLASGGNDNVVNVWDRRTSTPKISKSNHTAAVRALAWCPWQSHLLATGGGTSDKKIHFWNTTTGSRLNSIDAGSQVTSIRWSTEYKELVSAHGFPNNQIVVWGYPSLAKLIDIPAHDTRVLHTSLSPDGQTLATAAADENLKFWRLFESRLTKSAKGGSGDQAKRDEGFRHGGRIR